VLAPLAHLAEKHRCALLLQRHLNKQGGGRAVYRGLGSIAFVAACRFAMLVGRDPHQPGRCVLAQVRNSLAGPQPSLAYRLTAADGALPEVDWLGVSPCAADALLAGDRHREHGPRDQAAAFLEQFLAGGPRTSREIWEAAQEASLSARTVQRAKRGLGVRCRRVQRDGRTVSYWLLKGQELTTEQAGVPDDLARFFAEMEKQFPPRTPLDEDEMDTDRD
jgi:hypothetical protein